MKMGLFDRKAKKQGMFNAEQLKLIKKLLKVCNIAAEGDSSGAAPEFKLQLNATMQRAQRNDLRLTDIPTIYGCLYSVKEKSEMFQALSPAEQQTLDAVLDRLRPLCR